MPFNRRVPIALAGDKLVSTEPLENSFLISAAAKLIFRIDRLNIEHVMNVLWA